VGQGILEPGSDIGIWGKVEGKSVRESPGGQINVRGSLDSSAKGGEGDGKVCDVAV